MKLGAIHDAFNAWMQRSYPGCPFACYAHDAVAHSRSERQACEVIPVIKERLEACLLNMHPEKSKIFYYTLKCDTTRLRGTDRVSIQASP